MKTNPTARGQKIAVLEAKLAELKEAERLSNLRKKSLQTRTERAASTRRKILIGAFVIDQSANAFQASDFAVADRIFAEWLTRNPDRALFGLPLLAHPAPDPASQQDQSAGGER